MGGSQWEGLDESSAPSSLGNGVTVLKIQVGKREREEEGEGGKGRFRERGKKGLPSCLEKKAYLHALIAIFVTPSPFLPSLPPSLSPSLSRPSSLQVGLQVSDRAAKDSILGQLDDIASSADVSSRQVGREGGRGRREGEGK